MATAGDNQGRLDSELTTVNAVRELILLVTRGDCSQATYEHAFALGAEICPEILGEEVSLLRRAMESEVAREFRQRTAAMTREGGREITALELLKKEIAHDEKLFNGARSKQRTDQLKRRLLAMKNAAEEIDPTRHSE